MKKVNLTIVLLVAVISMSLAQTIKDIDGNDVKYKKIGDLYWTENIKTTTLWSNNKPLKQVDKAPTPGKDYSGALYIDANDKYRFAGRYYSVDDSNYYYTWNTANNVTATQQMAQSKFEEVKDNNTSICPCGWRVPTFRDIGNAFIALKLFPDEESFNKWLYDDGIFNSKFLFAAQLASAGKGNIPVSTLESKFFNNDEMAGIYGFMGMDDTKPLMKDIALGLWLRNMGISWGPDMQMDGAMLLITKPEKAPNTLQVMIKSEFTTELASVKCVTDEQGFQKYLAYQKEAVVIGEKKLKEQEELRLAKEKELAEQKKAEEEAQKKLEEFKKSPLTESEKLVAGTWEFEGATKDDQIEDYQIELNFSGENVTLSSSTYQREFTMNIYIESWSTQKGSLYGVPVKMKDKKQWYQRLKLVGHWGKKDDNTIQLFYETYENISGSLNEKGVKELLKIINGSMNIINITSFKSKKMEVTIGDIVELKGKKK